MKISITDTPMGACLILESGHKSLSVALEDIGKRANSCHFRMAKLLGGNDCILRRDGDQGRFEKASADEAMKEIAEFLIEHLSPDA